MNRVHITLISLALALSACAKSPPDKKELDTSQSAQKTWEKVYQDAKVSEFSGDYAVAEQKFGKVLKLLSKSRDDKLLAADIKARLAKIYIKQGHIDSALPLVEECITIASDKEITSAKNSELLVLMDDLAELIHDQISSRDKDYPEKLKLILKLQELSHTGVHSKAMLLQIKLANYYLARNMLEDARPHIDAALKIGTEQGDHKVYPKLSMLVRLSLLLRSKGYDDEAERVYQAVSKKYEKIDPKRAKAMMYMSLGTAYGTDSKFDKALDCYKKCLAEQKKLDDVDGEATTLTHMARIAESMKQFKEADRLFRQALKVQRTRPGSLSQELVRKLERYRDFALRRGDKRKAAILEKEARSYRGEYIQY